MTFSSKISNFGYLPSFLAGRPAGKNAKSSPAVYKGLPTVSSQFFFQKLQNLNFFGHAGAQNAQKTTLRPILRFGQKLAKN